MFGYAAIHEAGRGARGRRAVRKEAGEGERRRVAVERDRPGTDAFESEATAALRGPSSLATRSRRQGEVDGELAGPPGSGAATRAPVRHGPRPATGAVGRRGARRLPPRRAER